ncbi:putative 3',5'-cyclic phosphodiesterase pde-1 [Toxocara canis]|uniref:Putative 3',5'-cyclic phosphodiesterase pde-1 n=1 Tax=Toxocara canis TaxID=6265 RepID=A0A0B2VHQ7_TOXCA|nr:putative 3',5'-cyclic phosphodiesterase pde-1 [Toxocara canis]
MRISAAITTLRYILHQLNSGQLPLDDLKRNIEYAALVLETAYMDETRRICDEDDDLSEVTPETVPDEVREWLAATFTRQTVPSKREKPKFKSVANAIRTGIFFDKMFRKTQPVLAPIPPEIAVLMRNVDSWSFNPFEVNEVSDGHALKYVGFELFNRYGFLERFKDVDAVLVPLPKSLKENYGIHHSAPMQRGAGEDRLLSLPPVILPDLTAICNYPGWSESMFRKTQPVLAPIPPEIAVLMRNVDSWSFNPFEVNEVSDGHALKYVGFELFNRYGFLERFKVTYLQLFGCYIECSPYAAYLLLTVFT